LWRPFNARYDNLRQRLSLHKEILNFEVEALQTALLLKATAAQDAEQERAAEGRARAELCFAGFERYRLLVEAWDKKATIDEISMLYFVHALPTTRVLRLIISYQTAPGSEF
jgi:hypothetical protein